MSTDAIVESFDSVSIIEEKNEQVQESQTKDLALASLDANEGWRQLREHIESRIKYHREMHGVDTSQLKLEDIGQRFIVSNLVATELEGILNKVDITVKEVRENGTGK